jgi:hypothetical protein
MNLGRGVGGGGESENEVDLSFKINIFWDMTDSFAYLAPSHVHKSIFLPITRPKNYGSGVSVHCTIPHM